MKKLLIIALMVLPASCRTTVEFERVANRYKVVEASPVNDKFLVELDGLKGKFLLPPPQGKAEIVPGDSINMVFIKRVR